MDMMSNIDCEFCKKEITNSIYTPIKSNRGMNVYVCTNCGLIISKSSIPYISRPKPSMSCDANRSSIKYTKQLILPDHINFLQKNNISLNNYKRILDIGSNRGDFINFLKENTDFDKLEIDAIETDPDIVENYASYKNVNLKIARIESVDLPPNTYDFVYFVHTLEHLDSLNDTLIRIKNSLNSNSLLFLVVPNIEYCALSTFTEIFIDTHTFHFRFNVLQSICKSLGYNILFSNDDGESEIKLILTKKCNSFNNIEFDGIGTLNFVNNYIKSINIERNKVINAVKKIQFDIKDKFICWGAGRIFDGIITIGNLDKTNIYCLVDKYLYKYFDNFYDIKVNPIEFLEKIDENIPILICSFEYEEEIEINATKLGFKKIYRISKYLQNEI